MKTMKLWRNILVMTAALLSLASFLCVTPNYLSTIRKDITFEAKK